MRKRRGVDTEDMIISVEFPKHAIHRNGHTLGRRELYGL